MSKRRNGKVGESLSLEELAGVTGGQGVPVIPQPGAKVIGSVATLPGKTAAMKALAKKQELNILNSLVKDLGVLAKDDKALTADIAALVLAKTGLKKT